ncbi:hypothetical protein Cch01nite_27410 [Cellulomonas chitinilytica]|uniref:Uncharacterized protein n=1 Tax=Cellulomonas chitinilytica TaxID=398759 RepID=A0A919P2C4_9CELL|nr:hypothetical protein Cch01nite_27410 [Cellulomonas chitinilytica]
MRRDAGVRHLQPRVGRAVLDRGDDGVGDGCCAGHPDGVGAARLRGERFGADRLGGSDVRSSDLGTSGFGTSGFGRDPPPARGRVGERRGARRGGLDRLGGYRLREGGLGGGRLGGGLLDGRLDRCALLAPLQVRAALTAEQLAVLVPGPALRAHDHLPTSCTSSVCGT